MTSSRSDHTGQKPKHVADGSLTDPSRIEELLDQWEDAVERGDPLSLDQLCADCPELRGDVERQIERLQAANALLQTQERSQGDTEVRDCTPALEDGDLSAPLAIGLELFGFQFHARGGLGSVYVANDRHLHREVAVKFLRHSFAHDREARERFLLEAEITGRLDHPGVVAIHGIGATEGGCPFYAMRFVRGETLADAIRNFHRTRSEWNPANRGLVFRNLLQHFVAVCNTIAYAHNRGVVHRDIKPENIMLARYGETIVLDWGLAIPVDRELRQRNSDEVTLVPEAGRDLQVLGNRSGTPVYMSPEQARGTPIGPASDIYSLGATLYKVLTGEVPYPGSHPLEILERVRVGKWIPIRTTGVTVDPALESICQKAMAFWPDDRYASALDMAADLERWLGDEPVTAHAEGWRTKARRWFRRHRGWAQAGMTAVAASLLFLVLGTVYLGRLASSEHEARVAAELAHEQGLRVAARYAARTVANEMDIRWRILESEAADPELRDWLRRSNDDLIVTPQAIQAWLDARFLEHNETAQAASWFVTNLAGFQVARTPIADTIGKRFAFRDYYHGLGHDLPAAFRGPIEPIRDAYHSTVFRSRASNSLMVAFSVPIWSDTARTPERKVLGVLAMTVEMGRFRVLQAGLGDRQLAVLVDTRSDWIDGEERQGAILHHRHLTLDGNTTMPRVPAPLVEQLESLRAACLVQLSSDKSPLEKARLQELAWDPAYEDPVAAPSFGPWMAAMEPILVQGRRGLMDTGWIVVVQEQHPEPPDSR